MLLLGPGCRLAVAPGCALAGGRTDPSLERRRSMSDATEISLTSVPLTAACSAASHCRRSCSSLARAKSVRSAWRTAKASGCLLSSAGSGSIVAPLRKTSPLGRPVSVSDHVMRFWYSTTHRLFHVSRDVAFEKRPRPLSCLRAPPCLTSQPRLSTCFVARALLFSEIDGTLLDGPSLPCVLSLATFSSGSGGPSLPLEGACASTGSLVLAGCSGTESSTAAVGVSTSESSLPSCFLRSSSSTSALAAPSSMSGSICEFTAQKLRFSLQAAGRQRPTNRATRGRLRGVEGPEACAGRRTEAACAAGDMRPALALMNREPLARFPLVSSHRRSTPA